MAISNFFTAFYSALSDPAAYYSFQKEMNTKAVEDLYLNTFKGKASFEAVVLAVLPQSVDSTTAQQSIRLRPLSLHDLFLPEPCNKLFDFVPGAREAIISMHPVAYSKQAPTRLTVNEGESKILGMSIRPGDIVKCYFTDGPSDQGRLRGLTFEPMTRGSLPRSNMNLKCLRAVGTEGLASLFNSGGYSPYGDPLKRNYIGSAGPQTIENGKINDNVLGRSTKTQYSIKLIIDAIEDLDNLAAAFEKQFGEKLHCSGYRPYDTQVKLYEDPTKMYTRQDGSKGHLAANPGTSDHGWGVAIDISTDQIGYNSKEGFKSNEKYKWLFENAGRFNWEHPLWAQEPDGWPETKNAPRGKKGSKPESWHWEWKKKDSIIKK